MVSSGQGRAGQSREGRGVGRSQRKVSVHVMSHIWHQLDQVLTNRQNAAGGMRISRGCDEDIVSRGF